MAGTVEVVATDARVVETIASTTVVAGVVVVLVHEQSTMRQIPSKVFFIQKAYLRTQKTAVRQECYIPDSAGEIWTSVKSCVKQQQRDIMKRET